MAKRELTEINAGSMADIAFLLLIFFLVTTTMDQDAGINRTLPPIVPPQENPDKVKERNVFTVLVNQNDDLLVEGELMDISKLKDEATMFLTNTGIFSDEPGVEGQTIRKWVSRDTLAMDIARYEQLNKEDPQKAWESELKKLNAKKDAIQFWGPYKELDKAALISLKSDNGTSYGMYIAIQDELTAALNQLRDDLVMGKFNKTYLELDKKDPREKKIIMAVRQIFPERISEAEPNKSAE